jgi:tetratricopeptide (TPR) repeat protein
LIHFQICSNFAIVYSKKRRSLINLDKHEEALACLNKAIELDPTLIEAYNLKGTALIYLIKREEANQLFNKSLHYNLSPNDSISFYNKGFSLWRLEKYEEAIEYLDSAINLDNNFTEAYNYKGNALKFLGRYQEAIESYNKSIELNPSFTLAINNRNIKLNKIKKINNSFISFIYK